MPSKKKSVSKKAVTVKKKNSKAGGKKAVSSRRMEKTKLRSKPVVRVNFSKIAVGDWLLLSLGPKLRWPVNVTYEENGEFAVKPLSGSVTIPEGLIRLDPPRDSMWSTTKLNRDAVLCRLRDRSEAESYAVKTWRGVAAARLVYHVEFAVLVHGVRDYYLCASNEDQALDIMRLLEPSGKLAAKVTRCRVQEVW